MNKNIIIASIIAMLAFPALSNDTIKQWEQDVLEHAKKEEAYKKLQEKIEAEKLTPLPPYVKNLLGKKITFDEMNKICELRVSACSDARMSRLLKRPFKIND